MILKSKTGIHTKKGVCCFFCEGGGDMWYWFDFVWWWYGAEDDYIFSLKMQTFPGGVYSEFGMMMLMSRIIKK